MSVQLGWNFSDPFSEKLDDLDKASKWHSVGFNVSHKNFIPTSRGVYIVSVDSKFLNDEKPFNAFETPAYIGHSINLRKRFATHTSASGPDILWRRLIKLNMFCTFWFAVYPEKTINELKALEQKLINIYGSPLNKINSIKIEPTIVGFT